VNYTEWLRYLVEKYNLGNDDDGDGVINIGLNQNDPTGVPHIEGMSFDELNALFGDTDNVFLKTGKTSQERYYSNSFSTGDGGEDAVTSSDGFDTILDIGNGADKVRFDFTADLDWDAGLADTAAQLAYLEGFFKIDQGLFSGADGVTDTRLFIDMNNDNVAEWSVVFNAESFSAAEVWAAVYIYVNDTMIG
jgi:hypothetical protein